MSEERTSFLLDYVGAVDDCSLKLHWLTHFTHRGCQWHLRRILPSLQYNFTKNTTLYKVLSDNWAVWKQCLSRAGLSDEHCGKSKQELRIACFVFSAGLRTVQETVDLDDESIEDRWFTTPALIAMLVYWSHRLGTVALKKHCQCALVAFLSTTTTVEDIMSFFSRELPIDECGCPGRREGLCEQRRILRKVHRQLLAAENKTAHMKLSELLVALGEFLVEIGRNVDGRRSLWGCSDWMHGEHARVVGPRKLRRLDPEIRKSAREQVEQGRARSMHEAASAVHLPERTAERFVRANVLEYQLATVGAFRVAKDGTLSVAVDAARLRRPGKEYLQPKLQGVVSAVSGETVLGAATVPAAPLVACMI
eukprot:2817627-Amphidinium_carterae.6